MSAPPSISPTVTRLGFIGLGVMGSSMALRLLDAGFAMTVTTRTPAKAARLLEHGAVWSGSPREVAARSDVVFTMLGHPSDVREVALGPDGTLSGAAPGTLLVDMTTSEPALARELAERASAVRCHAVDAPVSGGDIGARSGSLVIMAGGDAEVVRALGPCWRALGSAVHQGPAGAGQQCKMVNQILVGLGMLAVAEALLYAKKAGLDVRTVLATVSQGAAASWTLTHLAPRVVAGDFAPGFYVEHIVKDLAIAQAEAARMGAALPGLSLAREQFEQAAAAGLGDRGTQVLAQLIAQRSGEDWPPQR